MLTKSRVAQLLFMLTVLLLLFVWRTIDPSQDNGSVSEAESDPQSSQLRCDYRSDCEFITAQGPFFLSIKELPIKAEEWINFELRAPVKNAKITKAQIVGKSMFMGRIPVTFNTTNEQLFSGRSLVGACTTAEMIWTLEITVVNGNNSELLSFDFMVKR